MPTEAELARQEGRDYEPASVLLERIRAARAAQADGSPRPRRRSRRRRGEASPSPESESEPSDAPGPTRAPRPASPAPSVSAAPINDDDLLAAVRKTFSSGGPRSREQALRDTVRRLGFRRLGFRRVGPTIRATLSSTITLALGRNVLQSAGPRVRKRKQAQPGGGPHRNGDLLARGWPLFPSD